MNAVEFIKQYGWGEAKRILHDARGCESVRLYDKYEFSTDDLKQLVDALELTNRVGNMVECKRLLSMLEKSNIPHMTIGGEFNGRTVEQKVLTTDFKKAIELVESVG